MLITRTHPITGESNSLELDVTEEQCKAWEEGMLVQYAFPNLSADEREFLLNGILPGEWDKLFPPDDYEDRNQELRELL